MEESLQVLFHASSLGRTDIIQHAIASLRKNNGSKSEEEIALLISAGHPEDDSTALHIASSKGHSDAVRALLNAGASTTHTPSKRPIQSNPTTYDFYGKRPYEVATDAAKETFHVYLFEQIAMGRTTKVEQLIKGGIPALLYDGSKLNDTTLHWACSFKNFDVVHLLLLSDNMDVNVLNKENQTPLHTACKTFHKEIISLLLSAGADTTLKDIHGKSAVDYCNGKTELVAILSSPPPSILVGKGLSNAEYGMAPSHASDSTTSPINPNGDGTVETAIDRREESEGLSGDNAEDVTDRETKASLLVLWPLPQRQVVLPVAPLQLSTDRILTICVASPEIDIYPLLTWTGLMECLDRLGLQLQVQRSAPGSHMRVCVDPSICPGRHRYELLVRTDGILMTASDKTGLFYALSMLVQLISLHAEIIIENDIAQIIIPCISISDWPDVANRGILWSFSQYCRSSSLVMKQIVEKASQLRVNQLFLMIDTIPIYEESSTESTPTASASHTHKTVHFASSPSQGVDVESSHNSISKVSTRLYALDEVCRRHCVELIPTVSLTIPNTMVVMSALRNFCSHIICLVLSFDPSPASNTKLTAEDKTLDSYIQDCIVCCVKVMTSAQETGCRAILLSASNWTTSHINPVDIALSLGLNVKAITLTNVCSPQLQYRSVFSHSPFVSAMNSVVKNVVSKGIDFILLPSLSTAEFAYPAILNSFYLFLFAGLAWSREASSDLLHQSALGVADGNEGEALIREVVAFVLFPERQRGIDVPNTANVCHDLLLDLFTGTSTLLEPPTTSANQTSAPNRRQTAPGGTHIPKDVRDNTLTETISCEGLLWALVFSSNSIESVPAPSRTALSACLRAYRTMLTVCQWRSSDETTRSGGTSVLEMAGVAGGATEDRELDWQLEELLASVHLLSIVCKLLLQAYNAYEKANITPRKGNSTSSSTTKNSNNNSTNKITPTVSQVVASLQPGSRSDSANALLEAMTVCCGLWRRRYERLEFLKISNQSQSLVSLVDKLGGYDVVRAVKTMFFECVAPILPGEQLFRCVTNKDILAPLSVEDVLSKLYQGEGPVTTTAT